jgi:hypothetical protein
MLWRGIEVELTSQGSNYLARATVPTRRGPIVVTASAPRVIAADLMAMFPNLVSSGEVSGDFFADLAKGVNKIAKSKTFAQVTSTIDGIASNPLLGMAASAIGGPAGAAALKGVGMAARAANSLTTAARRGDPGAKAAVGSVVARARGGDTRAKKAVKMLKAALVAQRRENDFYPEAPQEAVPLGVPVRLEDYERFVTEWNASQAIPTTEQPDGSYAVAGWPG